MATITYPSGTIRALDKLPETAMRAAVACAMLTPAQMGAAFSAAELYAVAKSLGVPKPKSKAATITTISEYFK